MGIVQQVKSLIIKITADTSDADKKVSDFKKKLEDVQNNPPKDVPSLKSLKTQLREATVEAQNLMQQFGKSSAEFANAAKKVAELKDEIDEFNKAVDGLDPDNKFKGFIQIAQGASKAVQGYTGAMAFLGVKSEEASEILTKLAGIMAFTDAISSLDDIKNGWNALTLAISKAGGAAEGTTIAVKAFNIAWKSVGIGLIIAAISYLVSNFDELKQKVKDLFPDLSGVTDLFTKVKASVFAVGESIIKFLIGPIKSLVKVVKGDFQGAADELKKSSDIIGNTISSYSEQRLKLAADAERALQKERIKGLEYTLKMLKAGSKDYVAVEKELAIARIAAEKVGSDEYKKEVQQQQIDLAQIAIKAKDIADAKDKAAREKRLAAEKAAHDKLVSENKTYWESIRNINSDNIKVINEGSENARQKELADVQDKYKKEIEIYNKKGVDTSNIVIAQKTEEARINKKYDDQISQYLIGVQAKTLDVYTQAINDINKQVDALISTASPAQKEILEASRKAQIEQQNRLKELNNTSVNAQLNLSTVTANNPENEKDQPKKAYEKRSAILQAQLEAEQDAYELQVAQAQDNADALLKINADYENSVTKIRDESVKSRKMLDAAEKESRLNTISAIGQASSSLAGLLAENTVAAKALAITQATIDTYVGANKALAQGGIFGTISAIGIIAAGLANVRKIIKVKVEGSSSGDTTSATDITAPSISTSSVNASANSDAIQNVRVVNSKDSVVKSYITDKELKDSDDRTSFLNNLSSL